mgnify:CR=1 FL=1
MIYSLFWLLVIPIKIWIAWHVLVLVYRIWLGL